MSIFHPLLGPPAYTPRTGWPALAAVAAVIFMFLAAALAGGLAAQAFTFLSDMAPPAAGMSLDDDGHFLRLMIWLVGLQAALVALTVFAAGLFSSRREDTLAWRPPAQGLRVVIGALVVMAVFAALFTAVVLYLSPDALLRDLKPFAEMMHSDAWWLTLVVAGFGAPMAEELLFRGFLFSALAKSRIGLWGTTLVTTAAWTALHAGYSPWGLVEVFLIGLYFSWLLIRTGSLWVPMLCHSVYNTMLVLVLAFATVPV